MDMFVDKMELDKLGFKEVKVKKEGRPGFEPAIYLKLYLYGYFFGIRSSRKLEREAARNIELHWLLEKLVPNYHSISDFRKENLKAPPKIEVFENRVSNKSINSGRNEKVKIHRKPDREDSRRTRTGQISCRHLS
jgi:transposase